MFRGLLFWDYSIFSDDNSNDFSMAPTLTKSFNLTKFYRVFINRKKTTDKVNLNQFFEWNN